MSSPELPDQLQNYNDLVERRAALVGVENFADDTVASLYQYAIEDLDRQIASAAQPFVERALEDAASAVTAYDQLGVLRDAPLGAEAQERIGVEMSTYLARIKSAAGVLTKFEVSDPRLERVLELAALAGTTAVASTTELLAPEAEQTHLDEAGGSKVEEQPWADLESAFARLRAYAESREIEFEESLTPAEFFAIVVPGVKYSNPSHRAFMQKVREGAGAATGLEIGYNFLRGRASRYNVTRSQSSDSSEHSVDDEVLAAAESCADKGDFDIDTYFSIEDGLLLAAFLYKFNDFLGESGMPKINADALTSLMEAAHPDTALRGGKELREARIRTVASIGVLFQNQTLVDAAIDSLRESDPRYPLFDYLFGLVDETTYPKLLELLEANKEFVITMDLGRRRGQVIKAVEGRVVSGGQVVAGKKRSDPTPPVMPLSAYAEAETLAPAVPSMPAVPAQPKVETVEERSAEVRQPKENASLRRCKKIIGDALRAMQDAGLDLEKEFAVHSLIPFLGQRLGRDVGAAREGGMLSRAASGNRQSRSGISVADALLAKLGNSPQPRIQGYVREHREEVREFIEWTIGNINSRRIQH